MSDFRLFASGFATVDVVLGEPLGIAAGGTAANVALAMSSLGWASEFGGTVGDDPAGGYLHDYLARRGVNATNLVNDPDWTTPVVVQEEYRGDHVWRFSCPICGARYAKHRPGPSTAAERIAETLPAPDVYFFDRATLYGIRLAEIWGAAGSTVVFEPAGLGRLPLFRRAAAAADLIKYSSERGPAFEAELHETGAVLIETLGPAGARYRMPGEKRFSSVIPAYQVDVVVDSAGAGDWTTAGVLAGLTLDGSIRSALYEEDAVRGAVEYGQQLGARACSWKGVRSEALDVIPAEELEAFACPRVTRRESVFVS